MICGSTLGPFYLSSRSVMYKLVASCRDSWSTEGIGSRGYLSPLASDDHDQHSCRGHSSRKNFLHAVYLAALRLETV